ncbi:MAG: PQQ-binding-like beta-propeller repeat protein [Anaerolineales bacterium]
MGGKYRSFVLIILITLCILLFYGCATYIEPWPIPGTSHSIQNVSDLKLLWSLENIYTEQDDFNPRMIANFGNVAFLGSLTQNPARNIIRLNGLNGNQIWLKTQDQERGYTNIITMSNDGLYIGNGGFPEISKYAFCTGKNLWSQNLTGRGIGYIYMVGDQVQISTDPFIFAILNADNGELIQRKKGEDIFVIMTDETYIPGGMNELKAVNTSTGQLIWDIELDHQLRLAPIFTDQIIFVRSGKVIGTVYAIDRNNGQEIWKTTDNIISNIALASSGYLYVLTRDGELLEINGTTGDASREAFFSNSPFGLNGDIIAGGYELAYDNSLNIIYVLLGDSRQLFALQKFSK